MAIMPSQIPGDYYAAAEVPEFDISLLNLPPCDLNLTEQHWSQFADTRQQQHPRGFIKQDHIPVPKIESVPPEYDYLDNHWHHWQQSGQQRVVHPHQQHHHQLHMNNMMASYPQTGSPTDQPLQLSDPPIPDPAAECQVTSTNLSPIPHSPYSPNSDVGSSFEGGMDGLSADGFLEGGGIIPFDTDLTEINIKGLTEEQLVSLTARDLNRICREMPEDVVKQLKKRRRTLKNRGYAYNSRVRRVTQKTVLETERDDLKLQIQQLNDRCKQLEREADQWKRRAQTLERGKI